jgi:hypothetical protein
MNLPNLTENNANKRRNWRKFLQPRRRRHDRMLVLNMSVFNFEPGWNRVFSRSNQRDSVWQ